MKNDSLKKVVDNLSERAETIISEVHKQTDIMQPAFADFKSLGSIFWPNVNYELRHA